MENTLSSSLPVRISIILDDKRITQFDDQEIHRQVYGHCCEMVTDLGIASTIEVTIRCEALSGAPYRAEINEQPCRIPYRNWPSIQLTSMQCARELLAILSGNRGLLIDAPLAQSIRSRWRSKSPGNFLPGLDRKGFQRFLILLVRHGFCLDRGKAVGSEATMAQWTPEFCFEQAVRSMENLGIKLHGNKDEVALAEAGTKSLATMLALMQDDLFYELGTRFPHVSVVADETLVPHQWRLQLNDLRLPVFEGLQETELLVNETMARLKQLDIPAKPARNPASGSECAIIQQTDEAADKCTKAGLITWNRFGYAVLEVSRQLRKHAECYVILDTIEYDLDLLQ